MVDTENVDYERSGDVDQVGGGGGASEVEMSVLVRNRDVSGDSTHVSRGEEGGVDVPASKENQASSSSPTSSSAKPTPPATPPLDTPRPSKRPRKAFVSGGGDGGLIHRSSPRGEHASSNGDDEPVAPRRNRRRGRVAGTCSRRVLRIVLGLGIGLLTFNAGWKAYWLHGCMDGCYEGRGSAVGPSAPEQVHLAYSGVDADGNPSGMTVVWTTAQGEAPPVVEFGRSPDDLSSRAEGISVRYLDTVHHRVSLEDLEPGTRLFYRCGNPPPPSEADASVDFERSPTFDFSIPAAGGDGEDTAGGDTPAAETWRKAGAGAWSEVYSFVSAPAPERWAGNGPWDRPVSVAVVGDLGLVNAGKTFDRLHQLVEDGEVDFVLHLGDIAYADDSFLERPWAFGYEEKWDSFMRKASYAFGSRVPYMVVPGNHEAECHSPACLFSSRKSRSLGHFNAYNARFRMPSLESGADHGAAMWYSFNMGPVHFVVVDTETDFPGARDGVFAWSRDGGNGGFGDQLAWLEEDLAKADQERDVRPWIVVSGHRPMYSRSSLTRNGQLSDRSETLRQAFEPLLARYKADVYLCGHVHSFERSFPVSEKDVRFAKGSDNISGGENDGDGVQLAPASTGMVYDQPSAPVHIVNGAGGNIEGLTRHRHLRRGATPHWNAVSLKAVAGVGILSFPSMAEMRSQFVTSNSPAEILDELTIRHN